MKMKNSVPVKHDENSPWWEAIEARIDKIYIDIIKEKGPNINVLDIGCDTGINLFRWNSLNPKAKFTGVDFNNKAIAQACKVIKKQGLSNIRFHHLDATSEQLSKLGKETFDLILCSEIFEHLYDEEKSKLMNSINDLLKPGGYLITTTPTTDSIPRNIYESPNPVVKKLNDLVFRNSYEDRILSDFRGGRHHHIGVANRKYYNKLAYRKGFEEVKVWPSSIIMDGGVPKGMIRLMDVFLIRLNPFATRFSTNLIYLFRKKSTKRIPY